MKCEAWPEVGRAFLFARTLAPALSLVGRGRKRNEHETDDPPD